MRLYVVTVRVHVTSKKDRVFKYLVQAESEADATSKAPPFANSVVESSLWEVAGEPCDVFLFAQFNVDVKQGGR